MRHTPSFSSSWTSSVSQRKIDAREETRNSSLLSTRTGFPAAHHHPHSRMTEKESSDPSFSSITLPRTVLFLVLFSTARHQIGCGEALHSIGQQVKRILEAPSNFLHFSHIFRVVIVSIGIHAPFLACSATPTPTSRSESFPLSTNAEELDLIQYPQAGLYTFQAALSSIANVRRVSYSYRKEPMKDNGGTSSCPESRLSAPGCGTAAGPRTNDNAETVPTLHPCVHVVSDGWLLPRSCVDAIQTPHCPMQVLPAVISNTLSAKEICAFSRSIACEYAQKGRELP